MTARPAVLISKNAPIVPPGIGFAKLISDNFSRRPTIACGAAEIGQPEGLRFVSLGQRPRNTSKALSGKQGIMSMIWGLPGRVALRYNAGHSAADRQWD